MRTSSAARPFVTWAPVAAALIHRLMHHGEVFYLKGDS